MANCLFFKVVDWKKKKLNTLKNAKTYQEWLKEQFMITIQTSGRDYATHREIDKYD